MKTVPNELSDSERQKILEFLKAHPVAILATTNPDGNPQASPIYIAVDEALHITFTTKRETQKYQNIAHNEHVMLVAYDASSQAVLQVSGKAIEVTDPEAQQAIYRNTLQAAKQTGEDLVPPIAKIAAGPYVGFKIEIDNIWLSEYGWGNTFAQSLEHANEPPSSGDPA